MPKESQNVDIWCTFSSLVSSYDRLYAMNNKSEVTLVCGSSYHTRAVISCDMKPHKQT